MRRLYPFLIATTVALILYAGTAAPSILTFFDDSLEFQLVAPSLGIAHPTGYPLYTIAGALWSRLLFPVGNWAWRMNMFSALTAALAVGLTLELTRRLLVGSPLSIPLHNDGNNINGGNSIVGKGRQDWITLLAGGLAAWTLGIVPIWWQQATVAEVYALHGLFMAAILLATIAVRKQDPAGRAQSDFQSRLSGTVTTAQSRAIFRLALLIGLSLTHHRMTLLLSPSVLLYLGWHIPAILKPQRKWAFWILGLLVPLLIYLYIPIRAAAGVADLNGSYQNSIAGFFTHVNASTYSTFLAWNGTALAIFIEQVSWIGIAWGLWGGLAGFWTVRRSEWLLIWGTFLVSLLFALFYNVDDVAVFLIPAIVCWAIFVGGGLWALASLWLFNPFPAIVRRRLPIWICGFIALFIGASPLVYNSNSYFQILQQRSEWSAHNQAVALAKVPFPLKSHVIGLEGEATAIKYMQQAEGLATNVSVHWANLPDERTALVQRLMAQHEPVYLTQEVAGIEALYSFSGEGPLVRVWNRGQIVPQSPQQALTVSFLDGALWLDGVDVAILDEAGGARLRIAYYWRPTVTLAHRLKLSLRLQSDGQILRDQAGHEMVADRFPLRQVTYSEFWVPDEPVRDVHYLDLPLPEFGDQTQIVTPLELDTILYDANTVEELGRISIPIRP